MLNSLLFYWLGIMMWTWETVSIAQDAVAMIEM